MMRMNETNDIVKDCFIKLAGICISKNKDSISVSFDSTIGLRFKCDFHLDIEKMEDENV